MQHVVYKEDGLRMRLIESTTDKTAPESGHGVNDGHKQCRWWEGVG